MSQGHLEQLERVHLLRQFKPQKVPARRFADPGLRREIPRNRCQHRALLVFQSIAQAPQVTVVAAVLQVIGNRRLGGHRRAQRGHQFQPLYLLRKTPGSHPANPITRRQAFRERTAMHHQPFGIKGFGRFRRVLAEVQLGVHIVFNQRHLMLAQQLDQRLLFGFGHGRANRVLKTGHAPHGLDGVPFKGMGECVEVHAVTRVHGDFHGLELEPLQHLQAGVKGRGFNGHQVAGFGHRLQAQVQGFQRAVGDQQLLHGQHQAADHITQSDLAT